MSKDKLTLVTELQAIEERKELFEKQRKAVSSYYLQSGTIEFAIETTDFNDKGVTEPIAFDKQLMVDYLTLEINKLQARSNEIIQELSQGLN